jgi:mannan endo-1,4-beta-mannosidase
MREAKYENLIKNESKLDTFISQALIPMVEGLKDLPGLAAWEIMNEPEGSLKYESDSDPCFDTIHLNGTGAGWAGQKVTMKELLRFHNKQASAIHTTDPKALVTVGAWCEYTITDENL